MTGKLNTVLQLLELHTDHSVNLISPCECHYMNEKDPFFNSSQLKWQSIANVTES